MKGLCAVFIIVTVLIFTTPLIAIEFEYSRKPVTSDDLAVSAVFESLLRVYGKGADQVVPYLEEKVVYWTTSGGGYGFQPKEEGVQRVAGILGGVQLESQSVYDIVVEVSNDKAVVRGLHSYTFYRGSIITHGRRAAIWEFRKDNRGSWKAIVIGSR